MHIATICVPYQIDVAHWGCALGPQAFLDHGLLQQLEVKGTLSRTLCGLNYRSQSVHAIQ